MAHKGKAVEAIGYMRTSSATNVGADKDSEKRQRAAIESFAKANGYAIIDWYYDAGIRGTDAVAGRPGFKAMLDRIASNGIRTNPWKALTALRVISPCSSPATTF
jgi:DNA invertase Pin-like site-specific DNA recombinase